MNNRQFADRVGNIDDQLIEEARYHRRSRPSLLRRVLAVAVMAAMMAASFTVGALAFSREVEVPLEQETIELPGIGLTLILPDSWKGLYGVETNEDGTFCEVYIKSIREESPEWGGSLFHVDRSYDEPMTPEHLYDISPVPCRYLFSTARGTYSMNYASDVQWDVENPEQDRLYHQMQADASEIRFVVDNILAD